MPVQGGIFQPCSKLEEGEAKDFKTTTHDSHSAVKRQKISTPSSAKGEIGSARDYFLRIEIMDIFQMERSGNGSKRFPKPVISFLIAFCLLYIASMFYRSSTSVLIGEVARDNITGEVTENVTRCYETESEDKRSSGTESMAVDKFLGGLLATGFDEESCISRRTLKKLSSSHANGTTDCNYIVWTPSNGLGNRIISMASSFLYAVLTNRVLLVDHGSDMAGIFCEPFPDTSWLLPLDFPLTDQLHSLQPGNVHSYGHLLKMNNLDISTVSQAPPFLHLYLAYNYDKHDKLFFQDQNQGFLQKVPWLILKSDLYFVPYLFLLPSFQQELGKLFPDKEAVFHHLARYLFHPSNQAWGLITRFYQAYLASADQKIGLQVRVFNRKASPVSVVQKQILGCIKKEKLLPQVDERKRIAFPIKKQDI
ncbi:hypothetical protein OIU78_013251 [Salix suchowensis]|nr:hypothetical protein OIU78_013251 [Salix suchowensis]